MAASSHREAGAFAAPRASSIVHDRIFSSESAECGAGLRFGMDGHRRTFFVETAELSSVVPLRSRGA